jgi:hypothetical protein
MMSWVVQSWYRFNKVDPTNKASTVLCFAAIELFNGGCRSSDDMATILIASYLCLAATRVNAPSSQAVH